MVDTARLVLWLYIRNNVELKTINNYCPRFFPQVKKMCMRMDLLLQLFVSKKSAKKKWGLARNRTGVAGRHWRWIRIRSDNRYLCGLLAGASLKDGWSEDVHYKTDGRKQKYKVYNHFYETGVGPMVILFLGYLRLRWCNGGVGLDVG